MSDVHNYSSWIAGNQAIAQAPHGFSESRFQASTVVFKMIAGREQWFQFSIPSPSVVDSHRIYLERVMILFRANLPAYIDRVDLWNGPELVFRTEVSFDGDESHGLNDSTAGNGRPDGNVVNVQTQPWATWGVNASVHAVCAGTGLPPGPQGELTFVAIGADFGYRD